MLSIARTCRQLLNQPLMNFNNGAVVMNRLLSIHTINDNLYLCTDKPRKIEIDQKSLKFKQVKENTKPIVVIISWLFASKTQINKYSKLYTDQGMDVFVGRISFAQSLFNIKSTVRFGQNIVDILHSNEDEYKEIFVHSFSAGGLMWGLAQKLMKRNMEKYGKMPSRVIGQVWDSVTHPKNVIDAFPFALFPNSKVMQSLIRNWLYYHLKYYHALQVHYSEGMQNLYQNLATTPYLIFASKSDAFATESVANELAETWKANGADVTLKVFEDSAHVKHFQKYPEVYLKYLHEHWERVKLLEKK